MTTINPALPPRRAHGGYWMPRFASTLFRALLLFAAVTGDAIGAVPSVSILSASGPLTNITVGGDGSLQVYREGYGRGQFFNSFHAPADSGLFVRTRDGVVHGIDRADRQSAAEDTRSIGFNPIAQTVSPDGLEITAVMDNGNAITPYRFGVVQTTRYQPGDEFVLIENVLTNHTGASLTLDVFAGADLYLAEDDLGYGYFDRVSGAVGGADIIHSYLISLQSKPGALAPTAFQEDEFKTIWQIIGSNDGHLTNSVRLGDYLDNGAALEWQNVVIAPGGTATLAYYWTFGLIVNAGVNVETDRDPPLIDMAFRYELVVTNAGPATASRVRLTNTLPTQVRFLSVTSPNNACQHSDGVVWCAWERLTNGASVAVTIEVSAACTGFLTNVAQIVTREADAATRDNFHTNVIAVVESPVRKTIKGQDYTFHQLPPQRLSNAIVLVPDAGADADPTAWLRVTARNLRTRVGDAWDVVPYHWREDGQHSNVVTSASLHGQRLGDELAYRNYECVHLVGHGLGARVIDLATRLLRERQPSAKIQQTFLDAYAPSGWALTFGEGSAQADHYFSTETNGAEWTQSLLPHAANFEITRLDPDPYRGTLAHTANDHRWAAQWYDCTAAIAAPTNCTTGGAPSNRWNFAGFGLSQAVAKLENRAWPATTLSSGLGRVQELGREDAPSVPVSYHVGVQPITVVRSETAGLVAFDGATLRLTASATAAPPALIVTVAPARPRSRLEWFDFRYGFRGEATGVLVVQRFDAASTNWIDVDSRCAEFARRDGTNEPSGALLLPSLGAAESAVLAFRFCAPTSAVAEVEISRVRFWSTDVELKIASGADGVAISWPKPCVGCELRQADAPDASAWMSVPQSPEVNGNEFRVVVPADGEPRYFRLER